jgi:hypothetical protein
MRATWDALMSAELAVVALAASDLYNLAPFCQADQLPCAFEKWVGKDLD